jgi:hypothetical protein
MSADLDIADGRDYASNLDMAGYASLDIADTATVTMPSREPPERANLL